MAEDLETIPALELANLGGRLRELRSRNGWTLDALAGQTSLSKSYLSRLEESERQPSLAALLALSRAFGVSLAELFQTERSSRPCVVFRASSANPQQGNGLTYTPLSSSDRLTSMQPVQVVVSAGREGEELYKHEGEEWLYVQAGTLKLTLSEDAFVLHPGDAAHFDAREPHRLTALEGQDVQLLLVACAAPRQLLDSYLS